MAVPPPHVNGIADTPKDMTDTPPEQPRRGRIRPFAELLHSLRFLTRQARNILLSTFALSTFFFDASHDALKGNPQLSEQFLAARRTRGKIYRRHSNLLLHSKLLANLTHQQE